MTRSQFVVVAALIIILADAIFTGWPWRFFRDAWYRRPRFFQYVEPGAEAPLLYGIAWRDYRRSLGVYCPVPFNILLGSLRTAWGWLKGGWTAGVWTKDARIARLEAELNAAKAQLRHVQGFANTALNKLQRVDPTT